MPGSRRIGRYVLLREIASGGMASVHLGRADGVAGFARAVAVKQLHPHYAKDPHFAAMFLDEAKMASRVQHPNVVQTLDVVADEGELFLVMELVEGASLSSLVAARAQRGDRVSPALAVAVMIAVLEGLHAAHEARGADRRPLDIVHRDVSPQNVLVGADGVIRVADFGVAKAAGRSVHTAEGQLKGKIGYMPPEQLRGEPLDRRADVYAASVVLWELLAGRRLYEGEPTRVMYEILDGEVAAPSAENPSVSGALDDVVLRGLSKNREARYATARDMAEALESTGLAASTGEIAAWVAADAADALDRARAWLEEATTVDPTPPGDVAGTGAPNATDVTAARDGAPSPGRRRAAVIAGLAVLVAVVGVGSYARMRGAAHVEAPADACGAPGATCCAGACGSATLACNDGACRSCVDRLYAGPNAKMTCAVMRGGKTLCWGTNEPPLVGEGLGKLVKKPTAIGVRSPTSMVVTQRTLLAVVDTKVTGWGQNIERLLGPTIAPDATHVHQGDRLVDLEGVTSVGLTALPTGAACAVANGVVSCWGANFAGALGQSDDVGLVRAEPGPVVFPGGGRAAEITAGGINAVCATRVGGGAFCWGNLTPWTFSMNRRDDGAIDVSPYATTPREEHPSATQIVPTNEGKCVIADGIVACSGNNRACLIDDGERSRVVDTYVRRPMPATVVLPMRRIFGGMGHFCALDATRALYCWGANDRGQAGKGTGGDRSMCVPQRIDFGSPVLDAALGAQHTCVLTADGLVRCFGANEGAVFGEPPTLEGLAWPDAKPIPLSCADDDALP